MGRRAQEQEPVGVRTEHLVCGSCERMGVDHVAEAARAERQLAHQEAQLVERWYVFGACDLAELQ
jgi:hypothetical protein